jgi:hypothetical protein
VSSLLSSVFYLFKSFLSSRLKKGIIKANYLEEAAEDGNIVIPVKIGRSAGFPE